MRVIFAIILGFFSGLLIYFESAMLFINPASSSVEGLSTLFVAITFLGGWITSSFLMVKGTRNISRVFSRGFLIGAAEWLAMVPIGIIFSAKAITKTGAETGAELLGAMIGGGFFSFLSGSLAVAMAIFCLLGFAVSLFIGREMKPEYPDNTKQCPQCAEMIKAKALKCRYCGFDLQTP